MLPAKFCHPGFSYQSRQQGDSSEDHEMVLLLERHTLTLEFDSKGSITMKKLWMAISIGSLLAAGALAESMSGTISDANCGAKHAAATEKDAACAKSCVKRGAAAVLVSDGKVYKIAAGSQEKVAALVGQKVTVNGKVDGGTVTIESAEAAK
jgi:hypothetical protein